MNDQHALWPEESDPDVPEKRKNAFEALCVLAHKNNWCWNIACTTCGAREFRRGLRLVAQGDVPDSALGTNIPWQECVLDSRQSHALVDICLDADIRRIAEETTSPDWLGYLGLVLQHLCASSPTMKRAPDLGAVTTRHYRKLSNGWPAQMLQLMDEHGVNADSPARQLLEKVLGSSQVCLRWQDLEQLESNLHWLGR